MNVKHSYLFCGKFSPIIFEPIYIDFDRIKLPKYVITYLNRVKLSLHKLLNVCI